ncbi:hypothetical protein [Streptomyces beihaiensis]|uniref:DUF1579 domain-containing protein n=1 Tax=Streptomyces beihaiensis TaxID=2984495 RepID=A0ABT3TNX4_9ACTN|nr:hypothetical protein [Streptomyces beihaiensis]MCX3058716.1 hypothetical protein [Streptomyces beihaiensis]
MRQHNQNHPALRALDPLVGVWRQWALVDEAPEGRLGPIRVTYAWTPDGGFLVRHAELPPGLDLPGAWREHHPFPTVAYIGYDDADERFTMLYADGRGVSRVYRLTLADGELWFGRPAPGFHQRVRARFDASGDRLTGVCEKSVDGHVRERDFGMEYERVGHAVADARP